MKENEIILLIMGFPQQKVGLTNEIRFLIESKSF